MEDQRLNINLNELENTGWSIMQLCFNIREVGVQEYADGEEINVILCTNYLFKKAAFGF